MVGVVEVVDTVDPIVVVADVTGNEGGADNRLLIVLGGNSTLLETLVAGFLSLSFSSFSFFSLSNLSFSFVSFFICCSL